MDFTADGEGRSKEKNEKGFMSWSYSITQELNSDFDYLARVMLGLG